MFLPRRFQSHLAIYNRCFYSAQEVMPFIIVHGTVENVYTLKDIHTFAHVVMENSAVVDTE